MPVHMTILGSRSTDSNSEMIKLCTIISAPCSEIWKTSFILFQHCKVERKIRCLKRDSNSHLQISIPQISTGIGSESYPI